MSCSAYPGYKEKIPNGDTVPNPCSEDEGDFWAGVGHKDPAGGGKLNPFGEDFKKNGYVGTFLVFSLLDLHNIYMQKVLVLPILV